MSSQNTVVQALLDSAQQGIEEVGAASAPGQRLNEMRDFYAYMFRELPALIERWKAQRHHPDA